MLEEIVVANKTAELSECKDAWTYDQKRECWCLEDVLYTQKAATPKFQRLSIYVPKAYMNEGGELNVEGSVNGYTAKTAPVIFANNSAGYMQMPHMWLDGPRCLAPQFLAQGYVYVTPGNRGHESKDQDGIWCGKAPMNLIDLKMALRFLRHNADCIPGNMERIISIGTSAGGAMSTLLAVTGDHPFYDEYLKEEGAFMDESDAVYASQIYCPIVDLEHADIAYEWAFLADHENEASPAGPAGVMNAFQEALSAELSKKYVEYFNSLELVDPKDGQKLTLREDGRSGTGYEYLMNKLNDSATNYLRRLEDKKLPVAYSVDDYIKGNYTYMAPAPMGEKKDDAGMPEAHHAGPGVAFQKMEGKPVEPPTLGDLLSRPPKGVKLPSMEPPMVEKSGKDKTAWLSWDGERAVIRDLDTYVLSYRRRMKPCSSFDILKNESGENKVFGTAEQPNRHFSEAVAEAIAELKDKFPKEYEQYYMQYASVKGDEELSRRIYLMNPMNFIGTDEDKSKTKYFRIRVGAYDADTSFTISMALALKLAEAGKNVDHAFVWDKPHCDADYPGECVEWIERICRE